MNKSQENKMSNIFDVAGIGSRVGNCIDGLSDLKAKVDNAIYKAKKARGLAEEAKTVELAWYKFGDKAEAIDALQKAMIGVSDAQGDQAEVLNLVLEYQQAVSKGMQFLFSLGAANMAENRIVIKKIQMELQCASEEQIGEMARQELKKVMAQLKAQLDVQEQQERLANMQKKDHAMIGQMAQKNTEQDERLKENENIDAAQDVELKRQAEKDVEHDEKIAAQDSELKRQAQKDVEHDMRITANAKGITELEKRFSRVKTSEWMPIVLSVISLIIAIVALVVSILK